MRVAVDAMGGDFAPRSAVEGALLAAAETGATMVLVGDRERVEPVLAELGGGDERIELEQADEVVAMEEPATAVVRKKRSSLRICARLVREGRAQAMVTAGHTGAAMIVAKTVIGTIPGVDRPALAAVFPNRRGRTVVLDVGANLGAKESHLREFAVMGHSYAQEVLGTPSPRVGLMSVGEEESKGTELTRRVYQVLKTTGLNFVGNVEGRDVFRGTVDVIVCDGFVGNVMLKSCESLVDFLGSLLRQEMAQSLRARAGSAIVAPAFESFRHRIDWSETGGAPLLGVSAGCFIAHGRSNAKAVKNAVARAVEFCAADLHHKIRDKMAELHTQEERLLGAERAS